MENKVQAHSFFSDFDIQLFQAGKHYKLFEKMGAHPCELNGVAGVYFAVWAPSAHKVGLVGNFNHWNDEVYQLHVRWDSSGIWEGFLPHLQEGEIYKYKIYSNYHNQVLEKADPYAFYAEPPPKTASIFWNDKYEWQDNNWMSKRAEFNALSSPISVYEVHLPSWRFNTHNNTPLNYVALADHLTKYVKEMGYTHVEFMPIMHFPYEPSWGYQITSYFAPVSTLGTPGDLKYLIDQLHQNGIGVILDWVPSHFPADEHAMAQFDGTHLYEHPDPSKGYHPDWKSLIFNYERNEVKSFLISNALFWLQEFHADGLRVDAVASMLYLDYSRKEGEWQPNEFGGNENLAAIAFIKEMNEAVYKYFPDVQTIAEESTAFHGVSRPTFTGGLGFGMKWMMGWMHDTLNYFKKDAIYRKYHHNEITFSLTYAFTENFMLPLSHDEVVYGKGAIIDRMPGDEWQRFANLRLLYAYMFTHPGAKLLFMGNDFGQTSEWNFQQSLDWHLLEYEPHQGVQQLIKDLNTLYRSEGALHKENFVHSGFEWINYSDSGNSVIAYMRKCSDTNDKKLIVICNFTPVVWADYRIGVPHASRYTVVLNTDDKKYWGSGYHHQERTGVEPVSWQGRSQSIVVTLPPLAVLVLKEV